MSRALSPRAIAAFWGVQIQRIPSAEIRKSVSSGRGVRMRRFVFVPLNLDGFVMVRKVVGHELDWPPMAVCIRTPNHPRRFEPFHRLDPLVC